MNEYLQATILGIVEGLTEFLPVSSTAHIRIAQAWMGQDTSSEYWKMFAVVIQLGAILSVVIYFRRRLTDFVTGYLSGSQRPNHWWNHPLALVMLSFVITAVPCYLIDEKIGELLENYTVMAWALIVGGVAMWGIDMVFSRRARTLAIEEMTFRQAVVIGLTQILAAAFPGTSRSMATIAGGQMMGLSRTAALEFSFFLSIPVMFAATGYKLLKFVIKSPVEMSLHQWSVLGIGFVVSFVVALAVVAWFMRWVRTRGFVPFAIYRLAAGALLLAWIWSAGTSTGG